MGNTRPYTEAHAIAGVDVVIMFKREVGGPVRKDLIKAFDHHLGPQSFERKRAKSGSAVWRRDDSDGDRLEEVHLHEGFMHVVAYEYRGWSYARDQALTRLKPLLSKLQSQEVEGKAVGLAYIDVFLNESGPYEASEVFSRNSSRIAGSIFNEGDTWKQTLTTRAERAPRTFCSISIEAKYLDENRDSESDSTPQKTHATEIVIKLSTPAEQDKSPRVEWSAEEVSDKLDHMHSVNKTLMLDLLSEDMIHRIGLRE